MNCRIGSASVWLVSVSLFRATGFLADPLSATPSSSPPNNGYEIIILNAGLNPLNATSPSFTTDAHRAAFSGEKGSLISQQGEKSGGLSFSSMIFERLGASPLWLRFVGVLRTPILVEYYEIQQLGSCN